MVTNFPQGVSSFGVPVMGGLPVIPYGKVLFVQSAHSLASDNNRGEDKDKPLRTIDSAIGRCAANAGDVIIVGPGHVETIAAAGDVNLDVAGVSIIGVGTGSLRPTVNFTTATTAEWSWNAANCLVQNLLFLGSVDALASPIDVQAADGAMLNCEWRDAASVQVASALWLRAQAARFQLLDFVYRGDASAGTTRAITTIGPADVRMQRLWMYGNFSTAGINNITTPITGLLIRDVEFRNLNSADTFFVDTEGNGTGQIGPNINIRLADNAANITEAIVAPAMWMMQPINIVNAGGESSMQTNITASTDA